MENGHPSSPLSPKVNHENQVEEMKVAEEEDMVGISDEEDDTVEIFEQPITSLQQENGNSPPGPLSPIMNHEQQEEVEVTDEEELDEMNDENEDLREIASPPKGSGKILAVIDLTEDEEDFNVSSTSQMNYSELVEQAGYGLYDWNANERVYALWHNSPEFKELAEPFIILSDLYGEKCYDECHRIYSRNPTMAEFASYCVNEGVCDRNWLGDLVFVNSERRGWPLQYATKGKIIIEETNVNVENMVQSNRIQWKYVVNDKLVEPDGQHAGDLKLWQFDIREIVKGEKYYCDLEMSKKVLTTVRKLMDCVWFPSDTDDFMTFYNHMLYERLSLLFFLEHPSPTSSLSNWDRGRIIGAIKHYHHLKNSSIRVYPHQASGDDAKMETADDDEMLEEDEIDPSLVRFHMEMKRHVLDLSYMLNPVLRPWLPYLPSMDDCDSVNPDEVILVMKETNIRSLKNVYEEMEKYGVKDEANIRVLPDLEAALQKSNAGTTLFVTSGNFNISGLWKLSDGGSIIGLKTASLDIMVSPSDAVGDVWMFMDGPAEATLTLKNLSLVVDTSLESQLKTMIHVKSGQLSMENCAMRDNNPASKDVPIGSIDRSDGASVKVDEASVFTNVLNPSVS